MHQNTLKYSPSNGRKIFADHVFDWWLIPNTQRTPKSQQQKMNNPVQKWAKNLNRHFSKEGIQMTNKHTNLMIRCSISLIFRELQIKTSIRYYLTRIRMATLKLDMTQRLNDSNYKKNQIMTSIGKDMEGQESLYIIGGNVKWYSHCGKHYGSFSNN